VATQDFALNPMGMERIKVHWTVPGQAATVLINGTILGMLANAQEQVVGKSFVLPDGSPLFVRFVADQPHVFRGEYPLVPVVTPVEQPVSLQGRKWPGRVLARLIINLVIVSFSTLSSFVYASGILFSGGSSVLLFLYLAHALIGCVGITGHGLLIGKKKIGFFLVIGYIVVNVILNVLLGVSGHAVNLIMFLPLISIIALYARLNRHDMWDQLT
jgi:hypothetical protein